MEMDWTGDLGYVPHVALGTLALGAGGRLARNLADIYHGDPTESRARIKPLAPATSVVPIEVTEDEAEELRRQGVKVRRVLSKRAEAVSPEPRPRPRTNPSITGALGYGALGAAGLAGGWALTDYLVDSARKARAKARRDRVKARIEALLDDRPGASDFGVAEQMKVGAAQLLAGNGDDMVKQAFGLKDLAAAGGLAVGGGALMSLLAGFQRGRKSSPARAKARALKRLMQSRGVQTPELGIEPVFIEREREEEETVAPTAVQPVAVPTPVPTPVVVVPESGSPAQQARTNPQVATSGSWV